ncbi:hypothetical protein F5Y15DRAFT_422559 [Xylariaceae sp. FL0016]|nr:hypothetical protein F5Y15DRAFT_422559 [Xylariaceae sp. FL0016]
MDERRVRRRRDDYHDYERDAHTDVRRRRSRSPQDHRREHDRERNHARNRDGEKRHHHRRRAPSPSRDGRPHHHDARRQRRSSTTSLHATNASLPFGARQLSRSTDHGVFRPLFARYLEVQKQLDIAELDEREVRGRWKSFVGRWNRGELAEGWYDPEMFGEVSRASEVAAPSLRDGRAGSGARRRDQDQDQDMETRSRDKDDAGKGDDDDQGTDEDGSDYGPTLPSQPARHHGPGIPTIQDLSLRKELHAEDRAAAAADLRHERVLDRRTQRAALDELVPRADAGTRERRLEKRQETTDKLRGFASAKDGGDVPEVRDEDLMGGGADGLEELKRMREMERKKKTEREVRREELERARREEREGKVREYREREEERMRELREIARARFG